MLNDILSLLDTHSMYLSSEEYSQGFSTLEGFVGIGVGLQETENGVQIAEGHALFSGGGSRSADWRSYRENQR